MPTCIHATDSVLLEEVEGLAGETYILVIGLTLQLHLLNASLQDRHDGDTVLFLLAEYRWGAAELLHVLTLQKLHFFVLEDFALRCHSAMRGCATLTANHLRQWHLWKLLLPGDRASAHLSRLFARGLNLLLFRRDLLRSLIQLTVTLRLLWSGLVH